jgi:hypothetical protein
VDVASFRVESLDPLRLRKVGTLSGEKCGASYIDREFITWLQARVDGLGVMSKDLAGGHYVLTSLGQLLLERFEVLKLVFDGTNGGNITLPSSAQIQPQYEDEIELGSVRITPDDLVQIFSHSVDGTLDLITKHLTSLKTLSVGGRGLRVKVSICLYLGTHSRVLEHSDVGRFLREQVFA